MDPVALTLLTIASGAGLTTFVASIRGRRAMARVCRDAALTAGLIEVALRSKRGTLYVEGRHGSLRVYLSSFYNWHARRTATRIAIEGLTTRLGLRISPPFVDGGWRQDIQLGDQAFDAELHVTGEALVATALLDARTRDLVRGLFAQRVVALRDDVIDEKGLRLEQGVLTSERILGDQPEWIASHLRDLLMLADRLPESSDPAPRLLANLREDRNPAVRRRNLLMLLEHADREVAQSGLRIALEDADEDVRLEAAVALGPEGRPALLAIASAEVPLDANAAARWPSCAPRSQSSRRASCWPGRSVRATCGRPRPVSSA